MYLHQSLGCLGQEKSGFGALLKTIVADPIVIIPRDSDTINGLMYFTVKYWRYLKRSQDYF